MTTLKHLDDILNLPEYSVITVEKWYEPNHDSGLIRNYKDKHPLHITYRKYKFVIYPMYNERDEKMLRSVCIYQRDNYVDGVTGEEIEDVLSLPENTALINTMENLRELIQRLWMFSDKKDDGYKTIKISVDKSGDKQKLYKILEECTQRYKGYSSKPPAKKIILKTTCKNKVRKMVGNVKRYENSVRRMF